MTNSYYNHTTYPATGAAGASAALRSELDLITAGFALLPTVTGNPNKALVINAGGTAVTVTVGSLALAGNFALTGAYNTTLIQGASTSLTLPVVSGTLATLAGTEELTNKTLTSAIGKGTWTTSGTWTLPAVTLGGAITYGGVTLSNAVTGTGSMVLSASPTLSTPLLGTPTSGNFSSGTFTWPTFNQNTTGTAAGLSVTLVNTSGGTGNNAAFVQYGVPYASSTTVLATTAAGTATTVLHGNAAGAPTFGAVSLTADVSGTLPNTSGGTGQSSPFTQYGVTYASTATALATTANGTTGQVLTATTSGAPSWAAPAAGGIAYTAVKTANYTAANNDGVLTNTTAAGFTVTLPTSPSVGNQIIVADSFGTWGTNNLTIDPTALIKIAGQTAGTTLTCNINSVAVTLVYTGATYGWDIFAQIGANDTSVLTQTNTVSGITNKTFVAPVLGAALASTLQATTTIGVGNATPSASGAGVSFPATQSASTNANTLDDYEEGSFTFTVTGLTVALTNTAYYTKIGNQVTVSIPNLAGTSNSTLCTITGFPVAIRSSADYVSFLLVYNASIVYNGHIFGGSSNTINVYWDAPESAFTASGVKGISNIANFTYTIY